MKKTLVTLVATALAAVSLAQLPPASINYQGRLTNALGIPMPDGNQTIIVKVFDAPSGGNMVFDSGQQTVATKAGVFSKAFAIPANVFGVANGNLWFEITVMDGQNPIVLSPRQRIASVPWAFWASTVSDAAITTPKLADVSVTISKLADSAVTNSKLASDSASLQKVSAGLLEVAAGAVWARSDVNNTNQYGQLNAARSADFNKRLMVGYDAGNFGYIDVIESGVSPRPLALQLHGGNVGIGTSNPGFPLVLSRNTADLRLSLQNQSGRDYQLISTGAGSGVAAGSFRLFDGTLGTDRLVVAPNGNVGIMTTDPTARLHINPGSVTANIKLGGSEIADNYDGILRIRSGGNNIAFDGGDAVSMSGDLFAGNASLGSVTVQGGYTSTNGAHELFGPTPFIDFHTPDQPGLDYSFRLINGAGGVLEFHNNAGHIASFTGGRRLGLRTGSPGFTLEVNGSAGKPGGGSWSDSSDRRLKTAIGNIPAPLEQLLGLKGVQYQWSEARRAKEHPGVHYGFIAQEVQKKFPSWVEKDAFGVLGLTLPFDFSALAVESIRDLNGQIQSLKQENAQLKARLDRIEQRLARTGK